MASAKSEKEKVNVWLEPDQVVWLKTKRSVSETVRALVTEAMSMEKLAESVRKKVAGVGHQASAEKNRASGVRRQASGEKNQASGVRRQAARKSSKR